MNDKTASLIGATGLIGSQLLDILLNDDTFAAIKVIVRRPVEFSHPKVRVVHIDFADEQGYKNAIGGSDVVFCAIGTTSRNVKGDKEAYRKVDYDIPVHAARFCEETGCPGFILVSSIGANPKSGSFYLKLKGEVEEAIIKLNIPTIAIFRPSLLLGKRKEFRLTEEIAKVLAPPLSFLMPSRYKPIKAHDVAQSMVTASKEVKPGCYVYHYREMMEFLGVRDS